MFRTAFALVLACACLAFAQDPPAAPAQPVAPASAPAVGQAPQPVAPAEQQTATQTQAPQPVTETGKTQPRQGAGSLIGSLLPLILIFAVLYFVMILPQQRRQKKHQQMLQALKRGDRVVLSSGILGIVSEVKENTLMVKVAENTVVEVEKGSVAVKAGSDK